MRTSLTMGIAIGAAVLAINLLTRSPVTGQASAEIPRTLDGRPDLNGTWQVLTTAAWDIQDHSPRLGVPAGQGVVENNEIPYQPWALEKRRDNHALALMGDPDTELTADPVSQCFMPGIPRATYMPYPFHIAQSATHIVMAYEFARTSRMIYMDRPHLEGRVYGWMGDSTGTWDGDTLVVDVVDFNDQTWFDAAGNFHSEALHVVERYTPRGANHLNYEVTIEDPEVFTRPWTMSMPIYRRLEENVELLEYHCLGFKEPLLYGHLSWQGG